MALLRDVSFTVGVIRENQFSSIANAAGDDALAIESDSDSSANLNLMRLESDFLTIAGMGLRLSADGTSPFRARVTEDFFTDVNSHNCDFLALATGSRLGGDAGSFLYCSPVAAIHDLPLISSYILLRIGGQPPPLLRELGDLASAEDCGRTGRRSVEWSIKALGEPGFKSGS